MDGRLLVRLLMAQIGVENQTREIVAIVAAYWSRRTRELRDEVKQARKAQRVAAILEARARGLRWIDAARLVGYTTAAGAWTLVDQATGDASAY